MILETAQPGIWQGGIVSPEPLRIYTGILGQVGDIIVFSATLRRLKELYPNAHLTFAVSAKYRGAGELIAGLPYVDRLFLTELYFEKLSPAVSLPWELFWPVDLRGDDEVAEQRRHDLVLETRPRHRRHPWWRYASLVDETAHMVGVPGPLDPRLEVRIPPATRIPEAARGKLVLHNDPSIDLRKAWPWEHTRSLISSLPPGSVVLLGGPGPELPGVIDLRGRTTLAEAAAIIESATCFIGIESGLTCIAAALEAPTVGLFGRAYIPRPEAVQPYNPQADYVAADTLEDIAPETVLARVQEKLEDRR